MSNRMLLGKIVGSAVATIKDPHLTGVKLLIVQPLNKKFEPAGPLKVAADAARSAGLDDIVVLVRSRDASMALEVQGAPVDLAVVAVVEAATVDECGLLYELPYGYTQFL
jgi:microcompartment protein CcmK/EutM